MNPVSMRCGEPGPYLSDGRDGIGGGGGAGSGRDSIGGGGADAGGGDSKSVSPPEVVFPPEIIRWSIPDLPWTRSDGPSITLQGDWFTFSNCAINFALHSNLIHD